MKRFTRLGAAVAAGMIAAESELTVQKGRLM